MPATDGAPQQRQLTARHRELLFARGNVGVLPRGGASGVRSACGGNENVKPPSVVCATAANGRRSPRLATNRPVLSALGTSRQHAGALSDITNISSMFGNEDKFKALKPPQVQQEVEAIPVEQQVQVPPAPALRQVDVQNADEYVNDINAQLFKEETAFLPRANYMESQVDLTSKMRTILIDWLIEVHMKYRLRPETLHLTVNLIDRYLSKVPITRKRLQLVGIASMFIASKFEEINPPELHDWVYITDKAYTKEELLVMECSILTTLSFQIMVPTAALFFPLLEKANGCDAVHREVAQYLVELGLLELRLLQFSPSQVVSAALLLSNELLAVRRPGPVWPADMVQHCRCTEASLTGCVDILRQLFEADRSAAGGQLQAVHKKFSSAQHHSVATMMF